MPRRIRRRSRYSRSRSRVPRRLKYSSETRVFEYMMHNNSPTGYQLNTPITVSTDILGTRKAKNFTITIHVSPTTLNNAVIRNVMPWALVYVPEGVVPGQLTAYSGGERIDSYYEPNQNVIMCGMIDATHELRLKSRLARNLNSGDSIYFLIKDFGDGSEVVRNTLIAVCCNYAISF